MRRICQRDDLRRILRVQEHFFQDWLWEEVEALAWQLDRSGVILPLPDLIIVCCARKIDAVVLTFDEHFRKIPGIRAVSQLEV